MVSRLKGEELVALIAICDLLISIDSGPVHVAGAVATPVIGLFGPVNPALVIATGILGPWLVQLKSPACFVITGRRSFIGLAAVPTTLLV